MPAKTKRRVVDKTFQFSEGTVGDALEEYYCRDKSKGTFLRGVRDATGFKSQRTADALYMGCWESVGVQLHGFEIKVSRSDWLREIQDVSKAGQFTKYCHYWWVAAPDGVVTLEEMPAHWGLKIVSKTDSGYAIRVAKAATLNQHATLDYGFFSSCLRQCRRTDPVGNDIERRLREAHDRGRKEGLVSNHSEQSLARINRRVDEYIQKINDFEKASGVRIDDGWRGPTKIGEAVKHVLQYGLGHIEQLKSIIEHCENIRKRTETLMVWQEKWDRVDVQPESEK